jgi:glycosyltransferase involved in cell wall biosynthesis
MISKTLVINTYILDDTSGSEPGASFHFIQEMSKFFETILVFTSTFTPEAVLLKLSTGSKNISFIQTQFPTFFPGNRFGFFYIKHRIFLLRQATQMQKMKFDPRTHIGVHYSLSNHLLGTAFYKSGIPYLFGPASTSKFPLLYWRIVGNAKWFELFRAFCIRVLLRFDPVVIKSFKNSRLILAGDIRTQELLNLYTGTYHLSSRTIPHTCFDLAQIKELTEKSEDKRNLMWCGAFSARKDPKLALEIMKSLRDNYGREDFTLNMYGSGRKFNKLVRYKKRYKLKNVEISPWIRKDHLLEKMANTKLLLFTSYRESGGAQILEALACKMNVVSTDATGATEWLSGKSLRFLGPSRGVSREQFADQMAEEVLKQYDSEHTLIDIYQFTNKGQAQQILEELMLFN